MSPHFMLQDLECHQRILGMRLPRMGASRRVPYNEGCFLILLYIIDRFWTEKPTPIHPPTRVRIFFYLVSMTVLP